MVPSSLLDEIPRTLERSRHALGADAACVQFVPPDGGPVICLAASPGTSSLRIALAFALQECPAVYEAIRARRPVTVVDTLTSTLFAASAAGDLGWASCLCVPIVADDGAVGVAVFATFSPHSWSEHEVAQSQRLVADLSGPLLYLRGDAGVLHEAASARVLNALPFGVALIDDSHDIVWANRQAARDLALQRVAGRPPSRVSLSALLASPERGHDVRAALSEILRGDRERFEARIRVGDGVLLVRLLAVEQSGAGRRVALCTQEVPDLVGSVHPPSGTFPRSTTGSRGPNEARDPEGSLDLAAGTPSAQAAQHTPGDAGDFARRMVECSRAGASRDMPIDLSECLRDWWPLLRSMIGPERSATLTTGGAAWADVDARDLGLAVVNALQNARSATGRGGAIAVRLHVEADRVRLDVEDDGEGTLPETPAAPELLPHAESTEGAAGRRLAAVAATLKSSGGRLEVASVEGGGTRASFWFPASTERAVQPLLQLTSRQAGRMGRVLVLGAEDTVRNALAAQLERAGFAVSRCATVAEADALIHATPGWPSDVVADLSLPDGSVPSIAAACAEADKRVQVLILSGHFTPGLREHIVMRGGSVVDKAVAVERLGEWLRRRHETTSRGRGRVFLP